MKLGPPPPHVDSDFEYLRSHTCAVHAAEMVAFQRSRGWPARAYRYRLTRD